MVLDIGLPGMDGLEVAAGEAHQHNLRYRAATARDDAASSTPASTPIIKPVKLETLVANSDSAAGARKWVVAYLLKHR